MQRRISLTSSSPAQRLEVTSHRFALEWPPDDSTIIDGELRHAARRYNTTSRYFICVHHTNNIVSPSACSLNICEEFVDEIFAHAWAEKGWVKSDHALEFVEKEHFEKP
jgi:hypothetical protein